MNKTLVLLLTFFLAINSALAHEDRILTLRPDGSMPEIPSSFGAVSLKISGLGGPAPTVQFNVGPNHNTLPFCMTGLIHTQRLSDVFVTGSWYHNEAIVPYYVSVKFYEPGYVRGRTFNSSFNIVFNLHTAQVLSVQRFIADPSGNGGQYKNVALPKGCTMSEHAA